MASQSKKSTFQSVDALIEEAKRLRRDYEQSEARFFAFLMAIEKEHAELWQGAGCETFDQFIRSNDLCMPDRYLAFRDGANRHGIDKAIKFGAPWTMRAGRVRDVSTASLVEKAEAFVEVHKTAPSDLLVKEWVSELPKANPVPDVNTRRLTELERLRRENAEMTTRLAKAERRIRELETENEKLKARAKK